MKSLSHEQISRLLFGLRLIQIRKAVMVGALALFAYDPLLTLRQEYKYIWKGQWNASKVIYLFLRYAAPAFEGVLFGKYLFGTRVPVDYCRLITRIDGWTGVSVHLLIQLTMALRTSAIYRNKRSAIMLLSVGYVLSLAGTTAIAFQWIMHLEWADMDNNLELGCISICVGCQPYIRICWIPPVLFDTMLLIMTIYKALQHGHIFDTRLLTVLYRDGFLYFLVIFTFEIVQLTLFNIFDLEQGGGFAIGGTFVQGFFRAVVSIACCRLILNLRGVLTEPGDFDISAHSSTDTERVTTIRFATPKAPTRPSFSEARSSVISEMRFTPPSRPASFESERAVHNGGRDIELSLVSRKLLRLKR